MTEGKDGGLGSDGGDNDLRVRQEVTSHNAAASILIHALDELSSEGIKVALSRDSRDSILVAITKECLSCGELPAIDKAKALVKDFIRKKASDRANLRDMKLSQYRKITVQNVDGRDGRDGQPGNL